MSDGNGLLTVHTYGICTHVVDGKYRRTILTNASNKGRYDRFPQLSNVNPHHARLTVFKTSVLGSVPDKEWFQLEDLGDRWEWHLHGVRIEIIHPTDAPPNQTVTCMPSLQDTIHPPLQPPPAPPIPPFQPVPELLHQIDPENTACHFDYPMVELIGRNIDRGAVFATATIQTDAAPKLHISRFDQSESLDLDLGLITEIALSNAPPDKNMGSPNDYLLHFLTTQTVPEDATAPQSMPTCSDPVSPTLRPNYLPNITGPGCSNTNYP